MLCGALTPVPENSCLVERRKEKRAARFFRHGADKLKRRSTVEGYAKYSPENSKWTKHTVAEHVAIGGNGPIMVGTPSQVADSLEKWVKEADVDGFNFVGSQLLSFQPRRSFAGMRLSFVFADIPTI